MARIGIIGAGMVGQATGKGLARFGHEVVFTDINPQVVETLRATGYNAVVPEDLHRERTDVSMLCVWTPTIDRAVDLGSLHDACTTLASALNTSSGYHLVVIRSTVPPGTIHDLLTPCIEETSRQTVGRDFGVCHNPEFLREVSALDDYLKPWVVVLGADDVRSHDILSSIVRPIADQAGAFLIETDIRTAEMLKYTSNLFNATKISFANEMWSVCRSLGVDGNRVLSFVAHSAEGSWNPGYGIRGGAPFGGSCLPKDTRAFLTFARENNLDMPLLEAVVRVNDRMRETQPAATAPGG